MSGPWNLNSENTNILLLSLSFHSLIKPDKWIHADGRPGWHEDVTLPGGIKGGMDTSWHEDVTLPGGITCGLDTSWHEDVTLLYLAGSPAGWTPAGTRM